MTAVIIIAILLVLLATGTPISIALGLTVLVFLAGFSDFSMETVDIVSQRLFTGLESFALMAIPFFILAGAFLTEGGIAARIIRFATSLVGWMPGGLAMAAILACAFFATISGSSPATVAAIGAIMLPAMLKAGYPKRFAVGVITTSGSLGILIPPSIVMIIYAVSTSTSADLRMPDLLSPTDRRGKGRATAARRPQGTPREFQPYSFQTRAWADGRGFAPRRTLAPGGTGNETGSLP